MTNGESLYISQYLRWRGNKVLLNGQPLFELDALTTPDACMDLYRKAALNYPKFFKMDLLCKAAWLTAAMAVPEAITADKTKVATVVSTRSGCLDVDGKFEESRTGIASPALFVYTLPNIMLGEICIAHGFKGEQMCTLSDDADCGWFDFYIHDLISNRGTVAALCGHIEATAWGIDSTLLWVSKEPGLLLFNHSNLEAIFNHQ